MGRIEEGLTRAHALLLRAQSELNDFDRMPTSWEPRYRAAEQSLQSADHILRKLRPIIGHRPQPGALAFFRRLQSVRQRLAGTIPSDENRWVNIRYESCLRNLTDLAERYRRGGLDAGDADQLSRNTLRLLQPLLRKRSLLSQAQRDALTLSRAVLGVERLDYHRRRAEHFLRVATDRNNDPVFLANAWQEFRKARFFHRGIERLRRDFDFNGVLDVRRQVNVRAMSLLHLQAEMRAVFQRIDPTSLDASIRESGQRTTNLTSLRRLRRG